MAGRGRGRGGLAQMHREMQNLQRQIAELITRMENQRPGRGGDEFDEEIGQGGANQDIEHEEEELEGMSFEERMLRALEGKNGGIKVDVLDHVGSLKPEELIDWLNDMRNFFE